jgi:hypothetical protein
LLFNDLTNRLREYIFIFVLSPDLYFSGFVTTVGAYPVFKINFMHVIPTLRIHSKKTTL